MVNDSAAHASLATAGKTPTLQTSQWEKSTLQWTSSYKLGYHGGMLNSKVHILFITLYCALNFQSWHIASASGPDYWVAMAFFFGFFNRFNPFTLVFNKLEYAVLNFSTSRCSMTVDIFLLLDCALIKHLYSGFWTTGFPSRGSGLVLPSSIKDKVVRLHESHSKLTNNIVSLKTYIFS